MNSEANAQSNAPPDWDKIKAEYQAGGITLRTLAAKYGVKKGTLMSRCMRQGWKAHALLESPIAKRIIRHAIKDTELKAVKKAGNNLIEGTQPFVRKFLGEIMHEAGAIRQNTLTRIEKADDENVRGLTGAWSAAVDQARRAIGLDQNTSPVTVNVGQGILVGDLETDSGLSSDMSEPIDV